MTPIESHVSDEVPWYEAMVQGLWGIRAPLTKAHHLLCFMSGRGQYGAFGGALWMHFSVVGGKNPVLCTSTQPHACCLVLPAAQLARLVLFTTLLLRQMENTFVLQSTRI